MREVSGSLPFPKSRTVPRNRNRPALPVLQPANAVAARTPPGLLVEAESECVAPPRLQPTGSWTGPWTEREALLPVVVLGEGKRPVIQVEGHA